MPIAPALGNISHKFGEDRRTRRHNGVDYPVGKGTPVKACADGIVLRSAMHEPSEKIVIGKKGKKEKKFTGSYGNVIIIYHGKDSKKLKHTYTLYSHLDDRAVEMKKEVTQGQVIGTSGRTGTRQDFYDRKGGYELHFEVVESSKELTWVKTGNLDDHFAKEDGRIDPEEFLRRSFEAIGNVKNPKNYPLSPEVQRALSLFSDYIGKGKTIVVTGGNRPFDSKIGAGSTSQHAYKKAADIHVLGQTHLQTANQAQDSGLFDGIGWYEEGYYDPIKKVGPHVHVDLRGTPARWGYDKTGEYYRATFPKHHK